MRMKDLTGLNTIIRKIVSQIFITKNILVIVSKVTTKDTLVVLIITKRMSEVR